jgi:hypothetical protein
MVARPTSMQLFGTGGNDGAIVNRFSRIFGVT